MRKALFLIFCLSLSLTVNAGRPKIGPGCIPGIGEGEGNSTGGGNNTEVTLPVGLPITNECDPSEDPSGSSNIVYTFDLDADGSSSANQAHSAFEKARDLKAAYVLIRINSFAEGWDVAENIRQEILDYDRPVMVYVNNQTIPAATFISSGADSIYTKKGSTISNKKSSTKSQPVANRKSNDRNAVTVAGAETNIQSTTADKECGDDVTMNEILYKAGLGNLTVVQHTPGFAERAVDFMMNPVVVLFMLMLIGFVIKKTSTAKLPGPMMYILAITVLLFFAPFQLSGLANAGEILVSLALIAGVIVSSRYNARWMTAVLLVALTFTLILVRAGDTGILLQSTSFRELLTLPSIPMGFVILGWWIGKIRFARAVQGREESLSNLATAA